MASTMNQQFKITKLAKDLGLKSKDLVDLLAQKGIEAKTTQKALEPLEFDILFEHLTKENQISDIGSYLDGVTCIPSKVKKATAKAKAESEPESEAAVVDVPAKEEKAEKKPVAKADKKPEAKADKKPEAKAEVPMEEKASESAAAPVAEKRAEEKPAEKKENRPQNDSLEKTEKTEKKEEKPTVVKTEEKPPVRQPGSTARQPYTGNPFRPQQNGLPGNFGMPTRPAGNAPAGARSQGNANANNNAYGAGRRPEGQTPRANQQPAFGGKNDRGGFGGQGRNDRDRQGGSRMNKGFDHDKGEYMPSAPKDTFKAQPIVRGASTNVNPDGTRKGPRVIDTHGSTVDLSKYDERLDSFVSDHDNLQGGNQKLKKQNNAQQSAQGFGGKQVFGKGNKNNKGRRGAAPAQQQTVSYKPTSVELPEEIIVGQLASKLHVTAGEVVKKLMLMGMMATINQVIDYDTAALIADEFGIEATPEVVVSIEERLFDETEDTEEQLSERAPVVCVMGHVDHGKTSILDAIRNSNVTAGEAGGITQHIGAYRVKINGRDITFLDTPGHAAFTAMRARGAMATDIAILVVAADDGVMPQTVEAINHAKAAGIDIVVAINKMDKPTANPDNIKQELTKYGLVPEEWGGDVICCPVSALTRQGIDDLLESVLLVADVKELKANPNRRAKGIVIEAKLDRGRGPVATVLVQNGTLHNGDIIIAGTAVGHVRSMTDHLGKGVKAAWPSVPVEITGLSEVPSAGDEFQAVEDERMARTLADQRRDKAKEDVFKANARANLNDLFAQISEGVKDLNIIVKADVDGSVEAVKASLLKLSNEEVKVRVIHAAAGGITEGDVTFAAASNAIIVGFNVRPDKSALDSAERQNVEIRTYRVIYECLEEIEAAMKGMLAPKFRENLLGHAEVRQTIHVPNVGTIAGCYIQDGKITRQSQIRVVRDGVVIFEDKISSLKRFKDDAKEVASGYECGVGLEKFNDIKVGDVLEAFIMEQVEPE